MKYKKYENHFDLTFSNGSHCNIVANKDVLIQKNALEQLYDLSCIIDKVSGITGAKMEAQYVCTPDFHKGNVIPIGTVVSSNHFMPKLMGNDISCGMQFLSTKIPATELIPKIKELIKPARQVFFEGKRGIYTSPEHRENIVKQGIPALLELADSKYKYLQDSLWPTFNNIGLPLKEGYFDAPNIEMTSNVFYDWIDGVQVADSQLGSIGGGNHFVEYLIVDEILDNQYSNNLKKGTIGILVHSGSLGFGHATNMILEDIIKHKYNKRNPVMGLPLEEIGLIERCLNNIQMVVNFATVNRTLLGVLAFKLLKEITNQVDAKAAIISDINHNMIDLVSDNGRGDGNIVGFFHRKGACSAREDEVVFIPGAMGSYSYICRGLGNQDTLQVCSHGAGRALSRGESMKEYKKEFDAWVQNYPVVTPVDFDKVPSNIKEIKKQSLMQESPFSYKGIESTIKCQEDMGMIKPIAKLKSLLTVKAI